MSDCLFCKIVDKKIPAKTVYEDAEVIVFEDIQPQAPVHWLAIPKAHVASVGDMAGDLQAALLGKLILITKQAAQNAGIRDFRLVINNGPLSGQSVFHLHVHLLSGRALKWPPG